jgi:ABC-2 type transport system permease protein
VNDLAGTGALVRLALRRDRVMLPAWIVVFAVTAGASAGAAIDLYPSASSRIEAAQALNNSQALVALYGRIYDPTSLGALGLIKLGGFGAVCVALLAIVVVVRHTRADEESGRAELVGATATGRRAPLAAALTVAVLANLALAVLTAIGLVAAGLPVDGSLAFGLAWAGAGIAFAAVAAVAAQLTTSARAATGLSAAVLAVVYAIRAVGDAADTSGPRWLSWLSPIGWAQQFRPYAGNRWWVLLLTVGFAAVMTAVAFALAARRDLGTGLLADRPGPASAAASLRSPSALAWRLQRGSFIGWVVGFVLMGALIGAIASSVGNFLNNANARDFITKLGGEQGLVDAFLAVEFAFAGIFASAYGIQSVMRLRSEETGGRAEPVLATAVGRIRWALSHILIALAGTTVLLALTGVAAGGIRAAQTGDGSQVGRIVVASVAQLPAAWVLTAVAVALFGLAPRLMVAGWVVLAFFVLLGELGPLFDLSQWVMDLSPFAHTPRLPGGTFSAVPDVVLTAIAAVMAAAGLVGVRRRDIA